MVLMFLLELLRNTELLSWAGSTHTTQVKLVLACCILHNWILRYGVDEVIPLESDWEANPTNEAAPNDNVCDNNTWASERDTWANQMWQTRNGVH